jgi:hypothetical protein
MIVSPDDQPGPGAMVLLLFIDTHRDCRSAEAQPAFRACSWERLPRLPRTPRDRRKKPAAIAPHLPNRQALQLLDYKLCRWSIAKRRKMTTNYTCANDNRTTAHKMGTQVVFYSGNRLLKMIWSEAHRKPENIPAEFMENAATSPRVFT